MTNISSSDNFPDPTILDLPFPALVVDNFISDSLCEQLILDSTKSDNGTQAHNKVHGGRLLTPWSSLAFSELLSISDTWRSFSQDFPVQVVDLLRSNTLETQEFLDKSDLRSLSRTILLSIGKFRLSPLLLSPAHLRSYRMVLESLPIGRVGPLKLFFLSIIRLLDEFFRLLKSSFLFFSNKKVLLPLFDYSYSNSGYSRSIHRDSDNRVYVVLLYLNDLDTPDIGGALELYSPSQNLPSNFDYPPRLSQSQAQLRYSIQPKAGRLIIFKNQYNSYHAVSPLAQSRSGRHFIYGGFSVPSSLYNNRDRLGPHSLPTEMFLY